VGVAELAALAAAGAVGVVALVSLALAHLRHHSLVNVAVVSAVLIVGLAVLAWRFEPRRLQLDIAGLIPAVVGLALAAVFFFTGFEYGTGDRDPGVYVETGAAIARTHSLPFTDDLVSAGLPGGVSPGAEWPGLWDQPGHPGKIFPQFYHLWPALMATAKDAGGFTGLFNLGPLVGLIAVALAVAIARRIAGMPGAWTAALILPTNMLEVWQAKYPSAEIFGQMLFLGGVLGVVLAVRSGWRAAAALGGLMLSLGYLERPDGILLILFAWLVLCVLVAGGKFDSRAGWFAGGLLLLVPYGFYQAYDLARAYTLANLVPSLNKVSAVMIGLAVVAGVLAWQRSRWQGLLVWGDRPRVHMGLGTAYIGICAILVLVAGLRPKISPDDYALRNGVRIRTFDEISFIRLTWFFSLTGIALMCVGIAYVGWHRWRFDRWLIGLTTTGLLAVYCYHVRNSPYLMWSTRRFVTTVVPGMVLLMACGAAAIVVVLRRYLPKVATPPVCGVLIAALLGGLATFGASQSWPLRRHNENGGSVEVARQLAALSGDTRGVFLWQRSGACCSAPYQLFGGAMMTIVDQSSALLPGQAQEARVLRVYVDHFKGSGRAIFYVANGRVAPVPVAGIAATKVRELVGALPHWAETYVSRPNTTRDYRYDITVYRLTASAP